jgi:putative endonuclease
MLIFGLVPSARCAGGAAAFARFAQTSGLPACRAVARAASEGCFQDAGQETSMTYVYILRSQDYPERYYVGVTGDLRERLKRHNAGEVSHTSKFAPWTIKTYVAFSEEKQAFAFERYLKSPSGRAFAKKRL